ncbi:MAG UNVERIFIED_CONTAM: tetratricopeptide repeat protein [Planctomycetaceae bacterium]
MPAAASGPDFAARFGGRSEKAWRDSFLAARMAEQKGDLMRASSAYEELLRKHPERAETHHRLGILCQKSGRTDEAVQHLARAHQIAPMDIEVLCDLGYIHYLQNRPKDAIETLQKAQQINPGHERTQANLAVALIAMDQVPSAVALLRQNMGEAPAATMVGFALAQRGELAQAKKYFSQALDVDASNQPAAEALVQIEEMLNAKGSEAESATELAPDTGVVAAGQIAALPFEVISEGVVTRATTNPAAGSASPIAAVRDGAAVLPAAAAGDTTAGQVTQSSATVVSAGDQGTKGELPSLRVAAASQTPSAPTPQPATFRASAQKRTDPPVISVSNATTGDGAKPRAVAEDGISLPPVDASESWNSGRRSALNRPVDAAEGLHFSDRSRGDSTNETDFSNREADRPVMQTWRSTANRIVKAGFSEPIEDDGFSDELAGATELPPVDSLVAAGKGESTSSVVVFKGSQGSAKRSSRVQTEKSRQAEVVVLPPVAAEPVNAPASLPAVVATPDFEPLPVVTAAPAMPVTAVTSVAPVTSVTPVTSAAPSTAPVASTAAPVAAPPKIAQASPTGTVGGLPLAFLRVMYVQMSDEQKVTFWIDLRNLPGAVSEAELSVYRELARSTQNLAASRSRHHSAGSLS